MGPLTYLPPISASQEDPLAGLDFGDLNITSEDDDLILDEAAGHIQENLEDELVQEALRKVSGHSRDARRRVSVLVSLPPSLSLSSSVGAGFETVL